MTAPIYGGFRHCLGLALWHPRLGGRVIHNVAITTDCPPKQAKNLDDQCAPGAPDLPKRATVDQPSRRDDAQPQSSPTAKPRRIPRGQQEW
jgi:hypothetical protein